MNASLPRINGNAPSLTTASGSTEFAEVLALPALGFDRSCAGCHLPDCDLDLEKTLNCGQVFHWLPQGPGFVGAIGEVPVYLGQSGRTLITGADHIELAQTYLALDHSLPEITATFPRDETMQAALKSCYGLRIVRQPPWECLASFITSALKQIRHIRAISLAIRRRFGPALRLGSLEVHGYPRPEVLAAVELSDLLECKLGFRARNLLAAARMVADGALDLEKLRGQPTNQARAELCRVPGVGEKIANCVLLFAYERLEVVPIDVWIRRGLQEIYFSSQARVPATELRSFSETHFGPHAGYAQQYLFHYWRLNYRKRR
jgi:N-glycosylase/DNA lyase